MTDDLDPTYIAARRVLLDALTALAPHRNAIVVVGAQAIYLRTGLNDVAIAPYTSDGDLALDPTFLGDDPALEKSMRDAGLELIPNDAGNMQPGVWGTYERIDDKDVLIPVDLMVPDAIAPPGGRRGARLGIHGKRAARTAVGLEAAVVDHSPLTIAALDPIDPRQVTVAVAGLAAMVVAKAHKIHDRDNIDHVGDKDAADMYRIMQTANIADLRATIATLATHEMAGPVTVQALGYVADLFGSRSGEGVAMAQRALQGAIDPAQVAALAQSFARAIQLEMM